MQQLGGLRSLGSCQTENGGHGYSFRGRPDGMLGPTGRVLLKSKLIIIKLEVFFNKFGPSRRNWLNRPPDLSCKEERPAEIRDRRAMNPNLKGSDIMPEFLDPLKDLTPEHKMVALPPRPWPCHGVLVPRRAKQPCLSGRPFPGRSG
ncbi:hypothetical protein DFAR_80003 [Desulfarculales bacterium]